MLAYYGEGHSLRVNYYSNPSVNHPLTNTPTGVDGLSNNAAVFTENRFAFASIGDESGTCGDTTTTPRPPPGIFNV